MRGSAELRDDERRPRWSVGAVVGAYAVVGLLWIVVSTPLAEAVASGFDLAPSTVELVKGIGFVVVTAAVLYPAMRQWETAYRRSSRQRRRDLEVREQRFRTLAEGTEGMVYRFSFTPRPVLEYMSPQFERITGFEIDELRTDPSLLLSRVHPEDRERLVFLTAEDPTDGPRHPAVTMFRFQRADGSWIWLEDHHTPEVGGDGRVEADQGIVFDVTARQREQQAHEATLAHEQEASERLRQIVQAHRTFLSGISHELRTPLTGIMGFAQTLADHGPDLDEAGRKQLLGRLTGNANRLGRLLDDLLDLDRVNRDVLEVQLEDNVDMATVAATIADELAAPTHRIRLDVPTTSVRLDRPKVERIIDNLLRNAVRHTPAGTTVWLHVQNHNGEVLVTVEDDGPGVDGDPETLFEPFRQGARASTQPSPGTGIGLALVRDFAALHDGTAWYEPREPRGSRFRVRLPVD